MQGADEANKIKTQEIFSMAALERRVRRAALMMETNDGEAEAAAINVFRMVPG
jgi:hypothetical protein